MFQSNIGEMSISMKSLLAWVIHSFVQVPCVLGRETKTDSPRIMSEKAYSPEFRAHRAYFNRGG